MVGKLMQVKSPQNRGQVNSQQYNKNKETNYKHNRPKIQQKYK